MIVTKLTYEAELAGQRYVNMVAAWRGVYAQAIAGGDFGTPKARQAVSGQAYDIARTYLDTEQKALERAFAEIALQAHRDALRDASAVVSADDYEARTSELLSEPQQHAVAEIIVQIERDVAFMLKQLRNAALTVELAARAQGISRHAAQIQYRVRHGDELRFYFADRAGRRWPSQKFIRQVVRGALLEAYNQVVMATLAEHRIDRAVVRHVDPNSRWDGTEITLLPAVDLPTYDEIRDEAFHANSDAVIARPEDA